MALFLAKKLFFFFSPINLSVISFKSDLTFFAKNSWNVFLWNRWVIWILHREKSNEFSLPLPPDIDSYHQIVVFSPNFLPQLMVHSSFSSSDSLTVNHVFIELENQIKFMGDLNTTQEKVKRVFSSTSARLISSNCCLLAQLFTATDGSQLV